MFNPFDFISNHPAGGHSQASHGRGGGKSSGGGGGGGKKKQRKTMKLPKDLDEEKAQKYVKKSAKVVEETGLEPYVDKNYRDAQLRGMNTQSSNSQNWTITDGDSPLSGSYVPDGHVALGVSVKGKGSGIRFSESVRDPDRWEPNRSDVAGVTSKLSSAFKSKGAAVSTVRMSGYDAGYGTGNVDFEIIIKK